MGEPRVYLTLGVDEQRFALPIDRVREILDLQPISRLPQAPPFVAGLTDVRGAGLLVIDLRAKFAAPPAAATNRTRIIVVDAKVDGESFGVGLVADCVFAVSDLSGGALEPPPAIGSRWRAEDIVGVGREDGAFVIVLDLDRLIDAAPLAVDGDRRLAA